MIDEETTFRLTEVYNVPSTICAMYDVTIQEYLDFCKEEELNPTLKESIITFIQNRQSDFYSEIEHGDYEFVEIFPEEVKDFLNAVIKELHYES